MLQNFEQILIGFSSEFIWNRSRMSRRDGITQFGAAIVFWQCLHAFCMIQARGCGAFEVHEFFINFHRNVFKIVHGSWCDNFMKNRLDSDQDFIRIRWWIVAPRPPVAPQFGAAIVFCQCFACILHDSGEGLWSVRSSWILHQLSQKCVQDCSRIMVW